VLFADPSTCGLRVFTQAMLHDGERRGFTLTNSQDLTLGY
jgi:hypothetical protein